MDKRVKFTMLMSIVYYIIFFSDDMKQDAIKGKRVLITGGSSGIGEQLAYQYSRLGARVFITARRRNLLEKIANKCKELGAQQAEFMASDLVIQDDRDKVIAEVKTRFGGLDHLILNHAVMTPRLWVMGQGKMTSFRSELEVNFFSFVDLASQSLSMLMESNGSIGVSSSLNGKVAMAGLSSYSTSKFQLNGFFSALRQELRLTNTGVSVTVCVLGAINTDIMKLSEEKERILLDRTWGYEMRVSPESAAMAIMTGVANRKYEIYYPTSTYVMVALHHLFPGYVEDIFGGVFLDLGMASMA